MNDQDREDVLMIVRSVIGAYLSDNLTDEAVGYVDESIRTNWHIIKAMRARRETPCGTARMEG